MKINSKKQVVKDNTKSLFSKTISVMLNNTLKSHSLCIVFLFLEYVPLIYYCMDTKVQNSVDPYEKDTTMTKYQNIFGLLIKYLIPQFYIYKTDTERNWNVLQAFNYIVYGLFGFAGLCSFILLLMTRNDSYLQIKVSSFISVTIRLSSDYLYFFFKVLNFHIINIFLYAIVSLPRSDPVDVSTNTTNLILTIISGIFLFAYIILSIIYSKIATNYLYFSQCNLFPDFNSEESYKIVEKILLSIVYLFTDKSKYKLNMSFYILFILLNMIYLKNSFVRFVYINNSYSSPIKFFIRLF